MNTDPVKADDETKRWWNETEWNETDLWWPKLPFEVGILLFNRSTSARPGRNLEDQNLEQSKVPLSSTFDDVLRRCLV